MALSIIGDVRERGERFFDKIRAVSEAKRHAFSAADMQRLGWTNSPKAAPRTVQHSRGGEMVHNFRPSERGRLEKALSLFESYRFVRSTGRVPCAVGMRPRPRQLPAIHNQVFLPDGTAVKPALQDFTDPSGVARLG